jgi:flagellar hook-basal body complex protein FliE
MKIEPAVDASAIRSLASGEMGNVTNELPLGQPAAAPEVGGANFGDLLSGAVNQANQAAHVADAKSSAVARGVLDDLHGTMISAKEAEISLHLVGTIRNKLLDAFHEIWRTSV